MSLILRYLKRHWLILAAGLLILLACDIAQLALPAILGGAFSDLQAVAEGRAGDGVTSATFAAAGLKFALLTVAIALTRMVYRRIIWPRSRRMEYEIRRDLFGHMQSLPPDFFHASTSGDLMSRASSDLEAVRRFYAMGLLCFADAIILIPAAFIMMVAINPWLAVAATAPLLLGSPLSAMLMTRLHNTYQASQDALGVLTGRVQEDIAGVRALKTYAREDAAFANFEALNREYTAKAVRVSRFDALFEPYFRLIPEASVAVALAWGGWLVLGRRMDLGDLVKFVAYVGVMIWPTFAVGMALNILQRAKASAKRLEDIFQTAPAQHPPEASGPDVFRGSLSFRGLTFTHRGKEAPAVSDLSLDVPAGAVLGITGPTGSGKSTLLNLAAGLLTAPRGTVFLDGADLGEIGRGKLRRAVTLVEQSPFLFSRSLEENLAYGRENCPPELVREAVNLAALDGDVARFEGGLATVVGERGVTLSGGQRLRAALARALVVEPRVLLLDDVFSAVDVETEKAIWSRIRPKLAGTTVIVVSHRISVLRECDRVAVIQDGRLSEVGTHRELLRGDGFYARNFALQEQFES
ncbi:MAG TPA: ABC transporter ATP-binding protein [Planctomycetota bacterium]|nr:ABC transporter ATP-binding protein [Planctomycetota bacterium]